MAFRDDRRRQPGPIFPLKSKFPNDLVISSRQFPALREKTTFSSAGKPELGLLNGVSIGSPSEFKAIPFAPAGSGAATSDT